MKEWYLKVETEDGIKEAPFYSSDSNPIEEYPDRFGHSFVELPNGGDIFEFADRSNVPDEAIERDDIRLAVDELDPETDYWIVDAHDYLGSYFPSVPDVPGYSHPTYFVGVPREKVVDVFQK